MKNIKAKSKSKTFSLIFRLGLIVFLIMALAPATVLAEDKVATSDGAESGAETSDSGATSATEQSGDTGALSESSSDSDSTGTATTSEPGHSDLESSGSETETAAASQNPGEDAATPAEDTDTSDSYDATPSQDVPDLTETSPPETPTETSSESDDQNSAAESPEEPENGSSGEGEAASASCGDTAEDTGDADGLEAGTGDADGVETGTPDADGDVDTDDTGSENQEAKVEGKEGNSYTAEVTSENIVKVDGSNSFTVKFTEDGSDTKLGSATMTIPEQFTGIEFDATNIQTSGDQSWTGGLVDQVLALWAEDNAAGNYLGQDEWVSATFTATTPGNVGEYDLATEAWQDADNHEAWQAAVDDSNGSRPESGVGTAGNSMATGHSDPVINVNDGTAEHPYQVFTANHLNEVREDLSADYIQMEDIDLDVAPYNDGDGWEPIGELNSSFTGSFHGNGLTISNLKIDQPNKDYVGLFGSVGSDGVINNVALEDVNVTGDYSVGGLIGLNGGNIINSCTTGAVTGKQNVGGLVGRNDGSGEITGSYATGSVTGSGNNVGGLVGQNRSSGTITNSYATGSVTSTGYYSVGGLVGSNSGTVSSSYATGAVTGSGNYVGGLVGSNSGTITDSFATGSVTSTGYYFVGGLVGSNSGTVSSSYATGAVTNTLEGVRFVGGLVGSNSGEITNSYATGSVTSTGDDSVGGLVGSNSGTINDSFWDTVTSGQATSAGGTGKTTSEMQQRATFLEADWVITGEDGIYPLLWWQVGDDDTYTWYMVVIPPGFIDVINPVTIPAFAGVRTLTAITGGAEAIITPAFISSGSQLDLAQALSAYQAALQRYEEEKEQLSARQLALFETELAIAQAAILALEASLLEQDGEPYDLAALMAAYETAEAVLGRNNALLSAGQVAAAQSLLQAIASVIALVAV